MFLFGPPDVEKLRGKRDVGGLIKALAYTKDSAVRRRAAQALGGIGDTRAVEPLIAGLRDSDQEVRRAAADALGRTPDARAVEPLLAALKDKDGQVQLAAAHALGSTRDVRAVDTLIAALQDRWLGRAAAEALGELRDPRAVEPLLALMRASDVHGRRDAAQALGKIGAPAVGPLMATLRDGNDDVRRAAADALDVAGWKPDASESGAWYRISKREVYKCAQLGTPAVEPLVAALKDGASDVRRDAAHALGAIGDARAVEPLNAIVSAELDAIREGDSSAVSILLLGGAVQLALARIQESTSKAKVAET